MSKTWHLKELILALALAAAVFVTFFPALKCGFVVLDDPQYVASNPEVQKGISWKGILWAFTTFHCGNWHPMTWLSHMVDTQLFGTSPRELHVVNLLIHVINTVLVFSFFRQFAGGIWRAAVVAAFFGLHPLRVESVAWIAERKDVLSSMFGLLALHAYARYARKRPSNCSLSPSQSGVIAERQNESASCDSDFASRWYFLAVLFFAFSLMCKPMLVSLPFVLILLDYWPLRRISFERESLYSQLPRLLKEKSWFFILAAGCCVVTLFAQRSTGSIQTLHSYPLTLRFENAAVSLLRYPGKTFFPSHLAIPYPYPESWPFLAVVSGIAVLVATIWIAIAWSKSAPWLSVGCLWFLLALCPVIGLVQAGGQSMADRYTYFAHIGLFAGLVWSIPLRHTAVRIASNFLLFAVLIAFASKSRSQLSYWKDTKALLDHTVEQTASNPLAQYALGVFSDSQSQWETATGYYSNAIAIDSHFALAHNTLAEDLLSLGRPEEARMHFAEVVRLCPEFALGHNNYGVVLAKCGRVDEAIASYTKALKQDPGFSAAHYNLGLALASENRFHEALSHYEAAARATPTNAMIRNNLGYAQSALGKYEEALASYKRAILLDSNLVEAHVNLGNTLARRGEMTAAEESYGTALALQPGNVTALYNLARTLTAEKKFDSAIVAFRQLLDLAPSFAQARCNLGSALREQGHPELALKEFEQASQLDAENAPLHYEIALTFASLGRVEEARKAAAQAFQLDRSFTAAENLLRELSNR